MDDQTIEGTARRSAVSVGDAARLAGAKPDTLRARLRRGSLDGYQTDSGEWFVYRDQLSGDKMPRRPRRQSQIASEVSQHDTAAMRARIAELERERDWLRQQVDRQTETAAELLARLGRLSDQIAQLQLAPPAAETDTQTPPAAAQTGVDAAGVNVSTTILSEDLRALRADLARQRRPWWRRVIGR